VSQRREIDVRLAAFDEIRSVLGAMKNLALMETRKLTRFVGTQRRVVETAETALADFLAFHPELSVRPSKTAREVWLLVGSERGFCGDFNEAIVEAAKARSSEPGAMEACLIVVGYKLSSKLTDDPRVVARLDGAAVVEELDSVLMRLIKTLAEVNYGLPPARLTSFCHAPEGREVQVRILDPLECGSREMQRHRNPLVLNLSPTLLLPRLAEHYLDVRLHDLFYGSLMAESVRRLQHMDAAVEHLQRQCEGLRLRRNALRQEEITEEIELILLSAEAFLLKH
jgi:F-type H+-transporting ATPase subunit gamma